MNNEDWLLNTKIYFNGGIVESDQARVHVGAAWNQYGLGVYTAFNVFYDGKDFKAFRLFDHYKRIINSAKILGLASFAEKYSYEQFKLIINELLEANKKKIAETGKCIVRPCFYVDSMMSGTRTNGLKCELTVFTLPFGDYFSKPLLDVCVSSWSRTSDNAIPSRAKITGSYINASLAKTDAILNGFDDCIFLDSHGHVAEGAVANIFMVKNGVVITPASSTDILEGITRDTVLKIAISLGIQIEERDIDRSELYTADELFFSGSSARIFPIGSVDHRKITDQSGPITQQIASLYSKIQANEYTLDRDWIVTL